MDFRKAFRGLERPADVRRSFTRGTRLFQHRQSYYSAGGKLPREKRFRRTNLWPGVQLDYGYIETCKETVVRVKHPTGYMRRHETEIRISVLPWSRGSYIDLRYYKYGKPTCVGILLHLDMIQAILPDLVGAVRRMEEMDTREEDQKSHPEVICGDDDRGSLRDDADVGDGTNGP